MVRGNTEVMQNESEIERMCLYWMFFVYPYFYYYRVEQTIWNDSVNHIYSVIEIIRIQRYTMSCETGSDSKRYAYMKVISIVPAPVAQVVECPLRRTGSHGFDTGPRHTKVVKNGTSCSSLGTQTYGVELGLVDTVSG